MQVKSGNDDLRQDAVMQQFFWLVNQFLAETPRTQRRALFIRTYKARQWGCCMPCGMGGAAWAVPACMLSCRFRLAILEDSKAACGPAAPS